MTEQEWCELWHRLDGEYQTSQWSPLRHDNRCHVPGHQTRKEVAK